MADLYRQGVTAATASRRGLCRQRLELAGQILVFPLFGVEAALAAQLVIGLAFFAVSLARGYLLRRLFERLR